MNSQLQQIAHAFEQSQGGSMALATLVRSRGSSYLRPGARMLVTASGGTFGILSGGCIEEEIARRAADVMKTGEPCLMTYDTRARFGCNGSIDIFIERVDGANSFLKGLGDCLRDRIEFAAVTFFEGSEQPGSVSLCSYDTIPSGEGVLVQSIPPPIHLVVAGDDSGGEPLKKMAQELGWKITRVTAPEEISFQIDDRTVAVVMTHNYGRDFVLLRALLPLNLKYVGLIGSRKRKERLLLDLVDSGVDPILIDPLYGPAGLDIGAESPEEIALSVVAEIQAFFAGRPCHSLRDRKTPIHSPIPEKLVISR